MPKTLAAGDKISPEPARYTAGFPPSGATMQPRIFDPISPGRGATAAIPLRVSRRVEVMSVADNEQSAECLLMAVYLSLSLQPRQCDGTREATVTRCGSVEIKLRETEEDELPLWLDVVEVLGQRSIDGAGFED